MSISGNFCHVDAFEPSQRTKLAIDEMNRIINMSDLLTTIIAAVPFFQIFAGRQSYLGVATTNASYQISTYDWKMFQDALQGVQGIKRKKLNAIAVTNAYLTTGEEKKFWRCVENAF